MLSTRSTTSAASAVAAAPLAPIATPTSAAASAGASTLRYFRPPASALLRQMRPARVYFTSRGCHAKARTNKGSLRRRFWAHRPTASGNSFLSRPGFRPADQKSRRREANASPMDAREGACGGRERGSPKGKAKLPPATYLKDLLNELGLTKPSLGGIHLWCLRPRRSSSPR